MAAFDEISITKNIRKYYDKSTTWCVLTYLFMRKVLLQVINKFLQGSCCTVRKKFSKELIFGNLKTLRNFRKIDSQ